MRGGGSGQSSISKDTVRAETREKLTENDGNDGSARPDEIDGNAKFPRKQAGNPSEIRRENRVFAKSIYNVKFASSNPFTYLEHFRRAKTRVVYILFCLIFFLTTW